MSEPKLLALDFDGVVCNGLSEYFHTTKAAYAKIWGENQHLEEYREAFYQVRPVVETGWEMPLVLRALVLGRTQEEIFANWSSMIKPLLEQENVNSTDVMQQVDNSRDEQIETDLESWLSLHQFYQGVIGKIQETLKNGIPLYIITTKEGRFVQKLLEKESIILPPDYLKGKEVRQPKAETIVNLVQTTGISPQDIWFVEDRVEALQAVQKKEQLPGVKLFLAGWGYNQPQTREDVSKDNQINLLSLEEFTSPFSKWHIKDVRPSQTSR